MQIPNGALLAQVGGKFKGDSLAHLCLFRHTEASGCWSYLSTIADPNVEGVNFDGSDLLRLPDGSQLCVIGTGGGKPIYQSKSTDEGRTWSKPRPLAACGVRLRLRLLSNGVVACSYGRVTSPAPLGDQTIFSTDGGESWRLSTVIYHGPSTRYTCMLETSPNELLYVYDVQVGWTEHDRNSIMALRIRVERT